MKKILLFVFLFSATNSYAQDYNCYQTCKGQDCFSRCNTNGLIDSGPTVLIGAGGPIILTAQPQVLPGGPNDYGGLFPVERAGTQFDQLNKGLNQLAGITPEQQAIKEIEAKRQLAAKIAEQNGLKATGISYDENGNPYVVYSK